MHFKVRQEGHQTAILEDTGVQLHCKQWANIDVDSLAPRYSSYAKASGCGNRVVQSSRHGIGLRTKETIPNSRRCFKCEERVEHKVVVVFSSFLKAIWATVGIVPRHGKTVQCSLLIGGISPTWANPPSFHNAHALPLRCDLAMHTSLDIWEYRHCVAMRRRAWMLRKCARCAAHRLTALTIWEPKPKPLLRGTSCERITDLAVTSVAVYIIAWGKYSSKDNEQLGT